MGADISTAITVNQNIWMLAIYLVALGFSEKYQLKVLKWISTPLAIIVSIHSVIWLIIAYF